MDRFFIDVAPLQEAEYTGVPQVAAKLSEMLLGDKDVEPAFFYNRHLIPTAIVEKMLNARTGRLVRWAAERYRLTPVLPRWSPEGRTVALHTNMKFARRLFPTEGQMVHDLTTVVTPQYHTEETNQYHISKFYGDLHTNDVTFCVSQSTASDVNTFYPGLPGPVVVSHLGVDWSHIDEETRTADLSTENYILVLGTIEPRKNIIDVLKLLSERPQLARMYRFVFGGRVGWGDRFEVQAAELGLSRLLDEGRIIRSGFVNETAKYLLFKHAAAVIYPSLYEGFGLPLAEALSLQIPVVTTASSSLPEVGQDFAHYFVPGQVDSLSSALMAALRQGRVDQGRQGGSIEEWKRHFSWARCYRTIRDGLFEAADRRGGGDVRL